MKNMPKNVMIAAFLNLIIGIGLLSFKILYGIVSIVLFVLLFIPKAWSRGLAIGVCALVVFGSLLWIFIQIAIGETVLFILAHAAVALTTGLVYLSFLFILFSDKARPFYIKEMFVVSKDDLGPEGWICPQCNAKNKFSNYCWNCDYSKDDYIESKKKKKHEKKEISEEPEAKQPEEKPEMPSEEKEIEPEESKEQEEKAKKEKEEKEGIEQKKAEENKIDKYIKKKKKEEKEGKE